MDGVAELFGQVLVFDAGVDGVEAWQEETGSVVWPFVMGIRTNKGMEGGDARNSELYICQLRVMQQLQEHVQVGLAWWGTGGPGIPAFAHAHVVHALFIIFEVKHQELYFLFKLTSAAGDELQSSNNRGG